TVSDFGGKGINVDVWVRDNEVLRITPRQNLAVNEYWMPDAARLVYRRYNEDRAQGPTLGGRPVDWRRAFDEAALLLKKAEGRALFLGSAWATVEDNYLLTRLAEATGGEVVGYVSYREEGRGDGWLISDDAAPNAAGCERLGLAPVDGALLRARLADADVLYVLDDDPVAAGLVTADDLAGVKVILHHYHTTNQTLPAADVAFAAAMSVETIGTYVSADGRAPLLRPAKVLRGANRALMRATGGGLRRLDQQGVPFGRWYEASNRVDCLPGWSVIPELAERLGRPLRYKSPARIMDEVAERVPAFAGATHDAMGLLGVPLEDVAAAV